MEEPVNLGAFKFSTKVWAANEMAISIILRSCSSSSSFVHLTRLSSQAKALSMVLSMPTGEWLATLKAAAKIVESYFDLAFCACSFRYSSNKC
jgi:hypothetical protein